MFDHGDMAAGTLLDKFKRFVAPFFFPAAVVDDDPPTLDDGDTPLFRAHKTNRGIYVHVANATGAAADAPSIVQGTDGASAERLATEATLQQLLDQGAPIAPESPTPHTVTGVAEVLPVISTPGGFRVHALGGGGNVFIRPNAAVTTSGTTAGIPVYSESSHLFEWTTTDGVYAIGTATTVILIERLPA